MSVLSFQVDFPLRHWKWMDPNTCRFNRSDRITAAGRVQSRSVDTNYKNMEIMPALFFWSMNKNLENRMALIHTTTTGFKTLREQENVRICFGDVSWWKKIWSSFIVKNLFYIIERSMRGPLFPLYKVYLKTFFCKKTDRKGQSKSLDVCSGVALELTLALTFCWGGSCPSPPPASRGTLLRAVLHFVFGGGGAMSALRAK